VNSYLDIDDARERVEWYIRYYNEQRLHSSIYYLTPQEVFEGKLEARLAERQKKLDEARRRREKMAARRAA
jgi:transposase InsO family protein